MTQPTIHRWICRILGHRYVRARRLTRSSHLIVCARCRGLWGMNTDVKAFLPWDLELQDMYYQMGVLDKDGRFVESGA